MKTVFQTLKELVRRSCWSDSDEFNNVSNTGLYLESYSEIENWFTCIRTDGYNILLYGVKPQQRGRRGDQGIIKIDGKNRTSLPIKCIITTGDDTVLVDGLPQKVANFSEKGIMAIGWKRHICSGYVTNVGSRNIEFLHRTKFGDQFRSQKISIKDSVFCPAVSGSFDYEDINFLNVSVSPEKNWQDEAYGYERVKNGFRELVTHMSYPIFKI